MTRGRPSASIWSILLTVVCSACDGAIEGAEPWRADAADPMATRDGGVVGSDVGVNHATLEQVGSTCDASQTGAPQLRRLTLQQLDHSLRDIFPEVAAAFTGFSQRDGSSAIGFSNDVGLMVGPQAASAIAEGAEQLAGLVTDDAALKALLPCAAAAQPDAACTRELVSRYGRRLFRRPLSAEELTRYTRLFDAITPTASFPTAAKWTLVALIQSPHSLYRRELGALDVDAPQLDDYELATELAYTFGDSTPDEALLELAAQHKLRDPDVRLEQARRLLDSPRGREGLHQFFREWLRYENVRTADRPSIPGFTAARPALIEETHRYLDQILFTDRGGVTELLTAPFTFVDGTLAAYYGLPDTPAQLEQVDRAPEHGLGLLAQGSLLASAANASGSSPTLRGLLVQEKLLCRTRPRPPANVPPLGSSDPTSYRTTRQHYEDAHARGYCKSCHDQFDPIGFALEHFDQGGRYRADEHGETIDASGVVRRANGSTLFEFAGQAQLAEGLAASPEVVDCVSGLAVAYAFGAAAGGKCLAEPARRGLRAGDYGIVELLARLAAEPHFTQRQLTPSDAAPSGDRADASAPPASDAGAAPTRPQDAGHTPDERRDIGIRAQYQANNAAPSDNVIGPFFQLVNHSQTPIALDTLRLRYYFTNEHAALCPDGCLVESYYAGIHPTGRGVTAERRYVAGDDRNAYLEISFVAGSPELGPDQSVEVQQYFHTQPYSDFDEGDDYSFDAAADSFRDHEKITVHQGDALVWGEPPP
ncbi:MAG: DUF1592 domain-containing protein [Polyangiales bacterium]